MVAIPMPNTLKESILFPLYRCGRFGGNIVYYTIDAFDFVYYPAADRLEYVVRYTCPLGSHTVYRGNRSDGNGIIVCSLVAHYTDALYIGKHGEILPYIFV